MPTDHPKPTTNKDPAPNPRVSGSSSSSSSNLGGHKPPNYPNPNPNPNPNPPEISNPDAATMREQWKFAVRQYSKWYSHAWGTAILAGVSFFALGWFIKGGNPLPSFNSDNNNRGSPSPSPPPPTSPSLGGTEVQKSR